MKQKSVQHSVSISEITLTLASHLMSEPTKSGPCRPIEGTNRSRRRLINFDLIIAQWEEYARMDRDRSMEMDPCINRRMIDGDRAAIFANACVG
jgi:hypothetical protein